MILEVAVLDVIPGEENNFQMAFAAADVNPDLEFVRERLHVVDEAGSVHVGSEAFAELWAKTPQQKLLAKIIRAGPIKNLSNWLYNCFPRLLYRWNRRNKRW